MRAPQNRLGKALTAFGDSVRAASRGEAEGCSLADRHFRDASTRTVVAAMIWATMPFDSELETVLKDTDALLAALDK